MCKRFFNSYSRSLVRSLVRSCILTKNERSEDLTNYAPIPA